MGKQTRALITRLLFVGGLVLFATALIWNHTGTHAAAQVSPGLNFSIAVAGHAGCDTTHGDTLCVLDPGEHFTLNVRLDSLPAAVPQYNGYDIEVHYAGVTSADNASTHAWPDCSFPAQYYQPGLVTMGCAIGLPPATSSTYTGVIGTNDFTCTASGTIALANGVGKTDLVDPGSSPHVEGDGTLETLNISCGPPPTATPLPTTPTPAARVLPAGGTGGTGDSSIPWGAMSALLGLAAAALVLSGWKLTRAR